MMSNRIEQYLDRQILKLRSQPLLLLLIAMVFMGGMVRAKRTILAWAVQAL